MKKLIFIMPSMVGGGAERVISILCNYFVNQYEVRLALIKNKIIDYELDDRINIDYALLEENGYNPMKRLLRLQNYMKKNSEAIIISFMEGLNLYVCLAGLATRNTIIISERNDPANNINKKLYGIREYLYGKVNKIVFQTEGAQKFYGEKVQKKGVIIPNPVRGNLPERYKGVRRKAIVTFARLAEQKNIPLMIDAFEQFSKKHQDYVMEIYGEGPLEGELREKIRRKNMEKLILLKGFSNHIHDLAKDASMFVLSSNYEGMSNAMIEAMAIGLPCICTDCPSGGARAYIRHMENGILVQVGNLQQLSEAMCLLADDQKLAERLSKEAIKVRELLSEKRICEKWRKLIDGDGGVS